MKINIDTNNILKPVKAGFKKTFTFTKILYNFLKENKNFILLSIIFIFFWFIYNKKQVQPIQNNRIIDSLNIIISQNTKLIKSQQLKIDSLSETKTKTFNYYETIIKDYSNPTIVSDDSITKYISKKLHNK